MRVVITAPTRRPVKGRPTKLKIPDATLLEDVRDGRRELFLRLIPPGLEVLLPVLGPRPAVIIDESGIRRGDLLRTAIGIVNVAQALDEVVAPIRIVRRRHPGEAV